VLAESCDGFVQRRLEVVAVGPIEVDVVDAEAAQRGLERGVDGLRAQAFRVLGVAARPERLGADLGRQLPPVTNPRPLREPSAEQFLALSTVATSCCQNA
jgi:hypothetical protein